METNSEQTKVTQEYIAGIKEGRQFFEKYGTENITVVDHIENLRQTLKGFSGKSPVGQMLKGELDFWRNQQRMEK